MLVYMALLNIILESLSCIRNSLFHVRFNSMVGIASHETVWVKKMKVLQINTVCDRGSVGRIAVQLCHALEKNKDQALLGFGRGEKAEDISSYYFGSKIESALQVLSQFVLGTNGKGSKSSTHRLIREILKYEPDVIHLHNIHGFVLNYEMLFTFLKKYKKPIVWTLHDCFPFTGHCAYFDYCKCDRWKTQCENCPQFRKSYPYGLLHDNSLLNYREKKVLFTNIKNLTIVTPSKWLKDLVKQSFLKEYEIKVIYNGIDLETFKNMQKSELHDTMYKGKTVVLGVANVWEARKGYSYFEELARRLDDSYQIILVGVSKAQLKKLPANIIGITRTSNVKELAKLYARADFFVNPTLEDNFPTTNLEALACGTPVITFRTGGSVESVDEDCGIIVEQGNIEQLENAIKENKNRFSAQACRNRALYFNKEDRYQEYLDLYSSLITNGENYEST